MNTSRFDGAAPRLFVSTFKLALAGGVSLAAMAMPAHAQETDPNETLAEGGDVDEPEEPAPTVAYEIVVTAQGREQSLADVPIAVTAVSGELLENAGTSDIRELNQVAPSLLVSSTGNESNGSARIRGIGTVGDNPGLESSVAVFVDGVYRSRSGNALSELGPIDRIEILRGPQGTLGGRNASAGLISIYTAPPELDTFAYGAATYGNYDQIRLEGGVNAPFGQTVAARIDGVFMKRDGFYNDVVNETDVNNRDRYLVRGQLLFEPNSDLSVRLIGDYSKKDEACCAAVFVQPEFAPLARISPGLDPYNRPLPGSPGLTSTQNPIIPILIGLGQNPAAFTNDMFDRDIYITEGRTYAGETEDYGVSAEVNWDLGGIDLTSITGYREYANFQASDTDYTQVDILYRAPGPNAGAREFKTFTQELRLQGSLFDNRLDWLVGGYYANEKLEVRDNLRFGSQYGTFANCRIALALQPSLGPLGITVPDPSQQNCLSPTANAVIGSGAVFGPATPLVLGAINNLAQLNDLGTTGDVYNQQSENYAVFTHNIVHVTDELDLTLGLRYTTETKDFDASFSNDNVICPQNRALLGGLLGVPALAPLAGGLIALSCQGNSTSELDGVTLSDTRDEDELTGTAVLSYQPTPDLLLYGSYSRGYKAGGFNLDRSALSNPLAGNPALVGSTENLQFDEETVTAYEIGAKYSVRMLSVGLAAFRQEFSNFQLNTFNGSVFLVQNVNACSEDLGGDDMDASAATGACDPDNVVPGVISQGVEIETQVNPSPYLSASLALTYADTHYEDNLVGGDDGSPLDPALRLLPGDNLSNAPEIVTTSSITWTPPIGDNGLHGLVFASARLTGDYNTGSDLLYGKEQDGYTVVNARIGVTGPDDSWAVEAWAQNLFDVDYTQVAFNTPFVAPQQTYSAYLAEPRTYGLTVRGRF